MENVTKAEVCLEFISHTMTVQPEVFVPSIVQDTNSSKDNQEGYGSVVFVYCCVLRKTFPLGSIIMYKIPAANR